MQLSILLLVFYFLHALCSLLALKTNIKYQIAFTQRKVRILSEKTIAMHIEQKHKERLRNFCKVYVFLFKKYTLIGLLFSRKPAHSIVILFSFVMSYIMSNFGIHWVASSIFPLFSSLVSITVQYEFYKSIFHKEQQEIINKVSKLMSSSKVAVVIYIFFTISSLAVLFFLVYKTFNDFKNNLNLEKLIANGFILAIDNFINKPLTFILVARIASQSSIFLQMIQREDQKQKTTKGKRQLELKGVINFSQEQLSEFVKEGDYELKQTKKIFVSSIFNKRYESQSQLVKSKSINHISCKNEFFFLRENTSNSRAKKEEFRLKAQKTVRFFAINQLEMNTQYQLNQENHTKSLENSKCHNATNTQFYELSNIGKSSNSEQGTKTLGLFINSYQNKKMDADHTQNTLSDIYTQKTKTQQQQKSKFSKPDKQSNKETNLMKVQQLETEMQEEMNQRQLKEHSTNTAHRHLRYRKRRPTAIYSQKQQQNLIQIYLDGNKQEIKDFKPRRRQSQIGMQLAKRYKTSKHIDGRSKPIVHQSQQQPNFFKLSDV